MVDKDVSLTIGADGSEANAEFEKVAQQAMNSAQCIQTAFREASYNMASAIKGVNDQMNAVFDKMAAAVNKVRGVLLMVGTALAGGAVFKKIIDETIAWNSEAIKLSKVLGITTEQASILNVALGDIYQTSDTVVAATAKMTKQLRTGEDAFKAIGVATRDQNGNFRNSLDVMLEVNSHLAEFKEGTDRNIEGQKIYGKAWGEVSALLKLNNKVMEEAEVKAKALHLIVGPEGVAQTKAYKAAMNDVEDIGKSLTVQFGNALLPVFAQTGKFMGEQGPDMAGTFKVALQGLAYVAGAVWITLKDIGDSIGALMAQAAAMLSGDFAMVKRIGEMRDEQAKKNEQAFEKWKTNAFQELRTSPSNELGGQHSDGGDKEKKDKSRTGEFEAALNALKQAHDRENEANNTFYEFGKERERAYWQAILQRHDLSKEERISVERKYLDASLAIRKEAAQLELEEMRKSIEAHKAGTVERIQAAGEAAAKIGEKFGLESKEYRKTLEDMHKAAEERGKQQEKLDQMAVEAARQHDLVLLDMERERLNLSRGLGEISAVQELQALRVLKEKEFQIELQSAQDKADLLQGDSVAYQAAMDKLAQIKQKHRLDMQKIGGQIVLAQKKEFDTMFDPVTKAFEKSANGVIQGTLTLRNAIRQMGQSMVLEFANMGVRMSADWLKTELFKTQASAAGATARGAIEKTAASESLAVSAMVSVKSILNSAWETMANVYKSIAAIPVVGPVMAPVAAAGAFAVVKGLAGSIASASAGYDIPAGVNPMTQLHQEEMVLPAHLANPMRDMLAGGGVGAGISAGAGDVHLHIHSAVADAKGFETWLKNNSSTLAPALRTMARNFTPI